MLKALKKHFHLIFLIAVFAITLWTVFGGEDLKEVFTYMQSVDLAYVFPSILCVILFILGESVIIDYMLRSLGTRPKFGHCCLYSFIGFFYSCITPSASGGQPMQIVAMRKDKIPVAVSTVVLAIVTITYKLVLVVIGLAILIIRPSNIMVHLDGVEALAYLGLALNVGCIAILLLLVFHPSLVRSSAEKIISLINRIRPFKHPEKISKKLDDISSQYTGTAEYYGSHKRLLVAVFLLTFAQRCLLFLVTWFTYKAFHLSGESLVTILFLQAMISVIVDMLPLPGGMGISENLFLSIFLPVFGSELVLPGMVVSRGISYYTQLLLSAVMTVAASFIIRKKD